MVLKLEDLKPESQVRGILGKEVVKIINSQMMGECCQVIVRDSEGNTSEQLLFRDQESNLEIIYCILNFLVHKELVLIVIKILFLVFLKSCRILFLY